MTSDLKEVTEEVELDPTQEEISALRALSSNMAQFSVNFVTDRHTAKGGVSTFERDSFNSQVQIMLNNHYSKFPIPQQSQPS